MSEYENVKRIVYGDGATFVPVCKKCNRFIKAPESIAFDMNHQPISPSADCKKCGKTDMLWEGYYDQTH